MLTTFYDFLIHHFKKKRKKSCFLKSEKNIKYVFSNTGRRYLLPVAKRRYLRYSGGDFEIFRPTGATRCANGVKFGAVQTWGYEILKTKHLTKFFTKFQISLHDFHDA